MEYKIYLLAPLFLIINLFAYDKESIADRIYQNECGADPQKIVWWNKNESFPSLGIGHFIWYPKGVEEKFVESFPLFVHFAKNRGVEMPLWLQGDAPWSSREEFLKDKKRVDILKKFLLQNIDLQADFMIDRLKSSIGNLCDVQTAYNRIKKSKNGEYILVDYLNFKGLGNNKKERYHDHGWGLIDVLKCMPNEDDAKKEFRECAKKLLQLRIQNAPKSRHEQRWLKGWLKRVDSYR